MLEISGVGVAQCLAREAPDSGRISIHTEPHIGLIRHESDTAVVELTSTAILC
jgi:hypothetical protein